VIDTFKKLYAILLPGERRSAFGLLVLVIINALLELVGISLLLPFFTLLSNPALLGSNALIRELQQLSGLPLDSTRFAALFGLVAFLTIVITNGFGLFLTWQISRFSYLREHALSIRLIRNYIQQPYSFFLNRNSSEMINAINHEAHSVVSGVLLPSMQLLAKLAASMTILGWLILLDPVVALTAAIAMGGAYLLVYISTRRLLNRLSRRELANSQNKLRSVTELIGGIKELKVLGREKEYLEHFAQASVQSANNSHLFSVVLALPRTFLEILLFGSLLLIPVYLLLKDGNTASFLPLLGTYAFAAMRLVPNLQAILNNALLIRRGGAGLNALATDLKRPIAAAYLATNTHQPLDFHRLLEFKNISYSYPKAAHPVFSHLNLTIPARSTVGLVGKTGSGKTTLVDLLLGLLEPDEGQITIDGIPLTPQNLRHWQNSVGYVPQQIFLADASVSQNIALGIPPHQIDLEQVKQAAHLAQIDTFITESLPKGYETEVGERGIRLSGGQRQRLGIARALYHNPSLLIFDEATSALDQATEREVMSAIQSLSGQRTIILIAHRLSTVQKCDNIFLFGRHGLEASGTYEELLERSNAFRKMAT
jgi:ABC-type multidrug transport system fused ATPase/permease subunit